MDKVRLLVCFECQSIEEVPWFEGPAERDETLEYRASAHARPSGERHLGQLFVVDKVQWDDPQYRTAIVKQISDERARATGLGQEFYDVKSTFSEDAMTCWKRHGRRTNCEDYKTDKMRLYPDTRGERKELGLDPKTRPSTFLCQFCPVNSVVVQKQRAARGDYNRQSWEES